MKKHVALFDKNGRPILGSDGMMPLDGRWGMERIKMEIWELNDRRSKNFPHKVAHYFAFSYSHDLRRTDELYQIKL